jgi:hypothetical protein
MRHKTTLLAALLLIVGVAPVFSADSAMVPGFSSNKHGFHFNNYFTGDILINIPLIGQVNLGKTSYGLCGGMSSAAFDNWVHNAASPPDTTPFAPGTPYRSYIYNRQDDTFREDNAFMIRRFIEWIPLPIETSWGVTGLQVRSHRQFLHHIKGPLEQGSPVAVALLKADINDLTTMGQGNAVLKNHQVLAIGFTLHTLPNGHKEWDIHIYDPNFHDTIQTLHTAQRMQTQYGGTTKTAGFRGFFALPYSTKRPPWAPPPGNLSGALRNTIKVHPTDDASRPTEQELKELNLPPLKPPKP